MKKSVQFILCGCLLFVIAFSGYGYGQELKSKEIKFKKTTRKTDVKKDKKLRSSKIRVPLSKNFHYKKLGYTHITEMGILFGHVRPSGSVRMISGVHLKHWLTTGIGFGWENLSNSINLNPLFGSIRGDFFKETPITPYYFLDIGYSFYLMRYPQWIQQAQGGFMSGIGLGIKFYTTSLAAFTLGVSYNSFQYQYTQDIWNGTETVSTHFSRMAIRLGVVF